MDKYISNVDLERFSRFLNLDTDAIMYESDIQTGDDVHRLFENTNAYFCVLFKENPNPGQDVGHWTCLIKHSEGSYEYFDCLADDIPDNILKAINEADAHSVCTMKRALMDRRGIVCGKWVISRILALPNNLRQYSDFFFTQVKFNKSKGIKSPDDVLNLLLNLPISDNYNY